MTNRRLTAIGITGITALALTTFQISSCASPRPMLRTVRAEPVRPDRPAPPDIVRFETPTLAVEFTPSLDRFTCFGPVSGPNMLHTSGLERAPAGDGSYTFFGGAYSWVAPQAGPMGWKAANGSEMSWPPDPAMDIGPVEVTRLGIQGFTTLGPVHRSGLREEKSLRAVGPLRTELVYTLHNTSDRVVTAGHWLNTAARVRKGSRDRLAFRIPPGTSLRAAMGDGALEHFQRIATPETAAGWVVLPLGRADWPDGIKVYIDTPADPRTGARHAEIAVWHEGWWLHRRLTSGDDASIARLNELGEGPVATYINPSLGIAEAELYAPIADIPPGGSTASTEVWTLIRSPRADADDLP